MKKLSLLIVCLATIFVSQAQQDSTVSFSKMKKYNVRIRTMDDKTIGGRFTAINDSEVVLMRSANGSYVIPAENIKSFTMKRKNSGLRGALIGFGVGALTGVIIGLASGDDPLMEPSPYDFGITAAINNAFAMTAQEKAVMNGIGLGATGAIVGAIIGAVAHKKFIIGGKKHKYVDMQSRLMMKLVQK